MCVRQSSDAEVEGAKEPGGVVRFVVVPWKGPETLVRPGILTFPGPEKPLMRGRGVRQADGARGSGD